MKNKLTETIDIMEEDFKLVADFDMKLIFDFFSGMKRQGPGGDEETKLALSFINGLSKSSKIVDIGCGTGAQTLVLAQNTESKIIASDISPEMIEGVKAKIDQYHLEEKVETQIASMDNLPFKEKELDLIWAESSIFIIGFKKGLTEWRKYLKDNGMIAVSEASWFTNERPSEIEDYWMANYPEMDTIPANIRIMQDAGYTPIAHFILPEHCWTANFYIHMARRIEEYASLYKGNKAVKEFLERQTEEIEIYNKYKEFFGYVFYIGKKR
jgi:Methylase involved in ubiquinone/menaquinone biosynthesis